MKRKHLDGEQMAERGRMGVREEVERRTGTAGGIDRFICAIC